MELDPTARPPFKQAIKARRILELRLRNAANRSPVTGHAPVDLCITSYGERLEVVAYAIESLAQGDIRPRRLILWISDEDFDPQSDPMLRRLMARGLEVLRCDNFGPHKKWYPYASGQAGGEVRPLVVADDDILYPRMWLKDLCAAWSPEETTVRGYRGHFMELDGDGEILPYRLWPRAQTTHGEDHRVFLTSGAGTIMPPALLAEMMSQGERFMEASPRADDVWLNVSAIRGGLRRSVIDSSHIRCVTFPRTQQNALHQTNFAENGNDVQLSQSLTEAEISTLRVEASH